MAAPLLPVRPPPWTGHEPYGLFSAATVIENMTGAALGGVVYPYRCDPATDTWPGPCADNAPPDDEQKNRPGGVDLIEGRGFGVYAFETCPIVAYTEAELEARATDSLRRGEQHDVEAAVWSGRGDSIGLAQRTDVVTLSAAAVSMTDAVALAHWWLGTKDGLGTLHINAIGQAAAAHLDQLHDDTGTVWHTGLGHTWSFGGGYPLTGPAGAPPPDGSSAWMFITRHVTLRRSTIRVQSGFRGQSNEHDSRAERVYVPTVPCPIAAIPVTVLPGGATVPDLAPPFAVTATPATGTAPLTVTARVTGETGPVEITWE